MGNQAFGPSFAAPSATPEGAAAEQAVRDIEDADIVKVVGDRVYALNRYKGLVIIDVANPDAPLVAGTLDLRGRGIEMYVIGTQVYVLLSADFYIPYLGGPDSGARTALSIARDGPIPPAPDFEGSQLAIIDAGDAANPALLSKLNLAGFATASRRVGNVIYVVGSTLRPYMHDFGDFGLPPEEGFVASVNVADSAHVMPVERTTFSGHSLAIHVSTTTIFAAGQNYNPDTGGSTTRIQAIDISDPTGDIALRGEVNVPGFIRNRFYMDDFNGVLRVATEDNGFGFRPVRVFTYDLVDLDDIAPLGQADIIENESLRAVRFDGPRGYVVTFLQVDPLFVLDLTDPANPAVTGNLEVPGFSTHIEPRGDRLIAIGIDDTDGWRPAVSYYDVSDPAQPAELGRVILGPPGGYTDSDATYDEKAFKIVDALGLIAVPFNHVSYTGDALPAPLGGEASRAADDSVKCTNGVQLVDFSDAALTQRGSFDHRGRVERVGVVGSRLFALSQAGFQTVDIADRDNPAAVGQADFFDADQMLIYANDCGYFAPINPGVGGGFDFMLSLILGSLCGAAGLLPLLATVLGIAAMRTRVRR